jgi:hypothetical protein
MADLAARFGLRVGDRCCDSPEPRLKRSARPDSVRAGELCRKLLGIRWIEPDPGTERVPAARIRQVPGVFDNLGKNLGQLVEIGRHEGAMALTCLHTAQSVGHRLVGDDNSSIGHGDRHGIGVIDVVLCPASLVVPMDGQLQVNGHLHARHSIEEPADELSTFLGTIVTEPTVEHLIGEAVLFERVGH